MCFKSNRNSCYTCIFFFRRGSATDGQNKTGTRLRRAQAHALCNKTLAAMAIKWFQMSALRQRVGRQSHGLPILWQVGKIPILWQVVKIPLGLPILWHRVSVRLFLRLLSTNSNCTSHLANRKVWFILSFFFIIERTKYFKLLSCFKFVKKTAFSLTTRRARQTLNLHLLPCLKIDFLLSILKLIDVISIPGAMGECFAGNVAQQHSMQPYNFYNTNTHYNNGYYQSSHDYAQTQYGAPQYQITPPHNQQFPG